MKPKEEILDSAFEHWTKVFILKDSLAKLRKSSSKATYSIQQMKKAVYTGEITKAEQEDTVEILTKVLITNLANMQKVLVLLPQTIEYVPESMRIWPNMN